MHLEFKSPEELDDAMQELTAGPIESPRLPKVGVGTGALVLGECVQGRLADGVDFLITAPIDLVSRARFSPDPPSQVLRVEPAHCHKSRRAVAKLLEERGLPVAGLLEVSTALPPAHGFGTSTADITASLRAAADSWGQGLTCEEISKIAVSIEPTDGSMYDEVVAYAHREGRLLERLGHFPRFCALTICDGEAIDTVEFDRRRHDIRYTAKEVAELERAWAMVRRANRTSDLPLLARACTLSACINDRFLAKERLKVLLELVDHGFGEGVVAAHSGTALALILDASRGDHAQRRDRAVPYLEDLAAGRWLELSSH